MDDDGYPEEEELEEIKNWKPEGHWSGTEPWLPILELVCGAWNHDMGKVVLEHQTATLITGGWSGNEDVLGALSDNFSAWSLLWIASFRGGKHVFGIRDFHRDDELTGPGTMPLRFNHFLDKLDERFPMPMSLKCSSFGLSEDYYLEEIDKLIKHRWEKP